MFLSDNTNEYYQYFIEIPIRKKLAYSYIFYLILMYNYIIIYGIINVLPAMVKGFSVHSFIFGYVTASYVPISSSYILLLSNNLQITLKDVLYDKWSNFSSIVFNKLKFKNESESVNDLPEKPISYQLRSNTKFKER